MLFLSWIVRYFNVMLEVENSQRLAILPTFLHGESVAMASVVVFCRHESRKIPVVVGFRCGLWFASLVHEEVTLWRHFHSAALAFCL